MPASAVGPPPPPGWYPDPTGGGTVRWWDGVAWTEHATVVGPAGGRIEGWGPRRLRTLKLLIGLAFVAVPVNLATTVWANHVSGGANSCNGPETWNQSVVGTWVPLAFLVLALGCLVAAIVRQVRRRNGMGLVVLAAAALIAALVSGFFAAFSVGWIDVCF